MRSSSRFSLLAVVALALLGTRPAATQGKPQQTVLHKFQNNETDGQTPYAGVLIDRAGNLYGTTIFGGRGGCTNGYDPGCGTVFELSPKKDGGWTETVLYSFQDNGADGIEPEAGLIFDKAGNLYGTTSEGGSGKCGNGLSGCGAVFELSPQSGGGWSEAVLYSFQNNGTDGHLPQAGLIFDNTGNLYGTTMDGGSNGCSYCGTVFELSPQLGGWSESVLYSFCADPGCTDGQGPTAALIFDTSGNLYSTSSGGGSSGCCGTVFELSPKSGGGWSETVLHTFLADGMDGVTPFSGVMRDAAGNLYGTTASGGGSTRCGYSGCGTVFELSPKSGGVWAETLLHSFNGGADGVDPVAGVIADSVGNLYGTTDQGGRGANVEGWGTVFVLLRKSAWAERAFSFNSTNGAFPYAGDLIFDRAGHLYGTTAGGGIGGCDGAGCGTVFEITP